MPIHPADMARADLLRALDALSVLGTLEAAAVAAGCSPAALVTALRTLVPQTMQTRPRKRVATSRVNPRPDLDDQPDLPGLSAPPARAADAGIAVAPVSRLKTRAERSSIAPEVVASAPVPPPSLPRPPVGRSRPGAPRLTVVPAPLILHIDAGARGNPGPSACAFVVKSGDAENVYGKFLGRQTNNEAEYEGLLMALRWLNAEGCHGARLHMDAQLVVMQVNGVWKVREPRLTRLAAEARTLLASTRSTLHHVRREKNREADREVNRVLDEEAGR